MTYTTKANSAVDIGKLEYCVRDDLNHEAPRVLAVVRPIEVELAGWTGGSETNEAPYFPPDVGKPGSRPVAMGPRIYIDRDDWSDDPRGTNRASGHTGLVAPFSRRPSYATQPSPSRAGTGIKSD